MSKSIKLFLTSDVFTAALAAVTKSAAKLNTEIQMLLSSAVYFAVKDGNVTPLNELLPAVGKGVRKTAIAQWVLAHAPVVMNDDAKTMKEQPFKFSRDKLEKLLGLDAGVKPDAEQAEVYAQTTFESNWTEHKEPPLVPLKWSVAEAIKQVLKTAKGYQGKTTKIEHADLLAQLEAMVKQPEVAAI
jgi:hypothetical protein